MGVIETDLSGLEVLPPDECLALLRMNTLGRIGLSAGALPIVLPVNYVFRDDDVLVATRRGTTISTATRNTVVAFEVDQIDAESGEGWSVLLQGVTREVTDPESIVAARLAPLARWVEPGDRRFFTISPDLISGRRLHNI